MIDEGDVILVERNAEGMLEERLRFSPKAAARVAEAMRVACDNL